MFLNTLVFIGKLTDWMVHMLEQAVGTYTDATLVIPGGYKVLEHDEILQICKEYRLDGIYF